jgi:SAM-dependent methyltransferase
VRFVVPATAYDRFMGRWSGPLADQLLDLVGVRSGQRVVDVGCGPGALTARLVQRVGAAGVAAVDPSEPFVVAARDRLPGVDVRCASAEALPFDDDVFDAALAQLVVQFMADPVAGLAEMTRVVRPGGVVAACVWDQGEGRGPLAPFYRALGEVRPGWVVEADRPGVREGDLAELCRAAGLREVVSGSLTVHLRLSGFEEWWAPFTLGVGPPGDVVAGLAEDERDRLREACARLLPGVPLEVSGTAWTVHARV